jgi:6-phosphogluconolactonase
MPYRPEIRIFENASELAAEAADFFLWLGQQAISERGRFVVALSGGSTPRALYGALTSARNRGRIDWSRVVFLFGDERCVPPDHTESNFATAQNTLFLPLGIQPENVHRMEGELEPRSAAEQYERTLRRLAQTPDGEWPRLDMILLGMGEDGHTASLFPGTPALEERGHWVVPGLAPQGIRCRLTLSTGVINHAGVILFLVTGASKAFVVRNVLEGGAAKSSPYPAALIRPERGRLIWFLDRAAASELIITKQNVPSEEE